MESLSESLRSRIESENLITHTSNYPLTSGNAYQGVAMITRLYTRNDPTSRLGIQIRHLTIHLPGETECMGNITETGDLCWLIFTGDHADVDFFSNASLNAYDGDDLWSGNDIPAEGQTLEDFAEAEHQRLTENGWILLPHDFGVSETASRIIARSYELTHP
jgi:hypothetical protein